ncbi:hypothetical protein PENTCL1PPCAC_23465 [Pristionchus entomophagus]|uniref:NLE domain-containing protein n=2 Tax=Pristionchus entomophagus TaxID=358040 RepID=A0AAV5U353_9BILA|nr:hypothetical protein PENTCL1PPCAC_23465 [Pristionchus entomophagus]
MAEEESRHIQVSFHSSAEKPIPGTEDAVIDVPISADWEKLNTLVNSLATAADDEWKERRFELLIGSTFLRSSLSEFIQENHLDFERVVKIECVDGYDPPQPHLSLNGPDWISSVHVTPSVYIATGFDGSVTVWDKKGEKISQHSREESAVKGAAVLQKPKGAGVGGLRLATGLENGSIWVQEWAADGTVTAVAALKGHARSVEAVRVGVDGTRLISGGFDAHVKVWNLTADASDVHDAPKAKNEKRAREEFVTKTPMVTLAAHSDAIVALEWSPHQKERAFSASWDHSLLQWDLELAGEVSRIRAQRGFTSISVHPSTGLIIGGLTDACPRLYDPRSSEGSFLKQSFIGHKGWVTCVRWTERDDHSFVSSSFDGTVKMWDSRSAKTPVYDISGHEDRVLCCGVGEGAILSGGVDTKVNIFTF